MSSDKDIYTFNGSRSINLGSIFFATKSHFQKLSQVKNIKKYFNTNVFENKIKREKYSLSPIPPSPLSFQEHLI